MFDTPLLMSRNTGLTVEQRAVKRAVDIIISLIAFIPAAPIMALVACALNWMMAEVCSISRNV